MLISYGKEYVIPEHIKKASTRTEFKFNINMDNDFVDLIFNNDLEALKSGIMLDVIKKLDYYELGELDKLLNSLELREHQIFMVNLIDIAELLI